MNVVVLLPNWIGDAVMATPAVRALRARFGAPDQLLGVTRRHASQVLDGLTWFDDLIVYDRRATEDCPGAIGLIRELRRRRIDAIVLLTNSLRTGLIGWMSGASRRVGYDRCWRGVLLTDRVQPPREAGRLRPVSPVDYYLKLVEQLGCDVGDKRVELKTTAKDEEQADCVWKRHALVQSARVIVLNSGGAYGAAKHWPAARFAELARRFAEQPETRVLVICGPAERDVAEAIERAASHPRVTSLARERLSVGLSKACVRRSQLMVTTDSGPRHFAAAFGVPCITLFGPTDPRWSWNYHDGETVLQQPLDCVPCARRTCPLRHHRCMTETTVDQVFQTAVRKLGVSHGTKVA